MTTTSFGCLQRLSLFERYAADKIAGGLSPKTVRNHLVLAGLMFKMARRWRWVNENPLDLVDKPAAGQADTETMNAATIAELVAAYRVLEARRGRRNETVLVRGRAQDDRCGALHGPETRRTARPALD